eukprot:scaffold1077_cov388-Prasinococcus_capsulatus_cf.AAC.10
MRLSAHREIRFHPSVERLCEGAVPSTCTVLVSVCTAALFHTDRSMLHHSMVQEQVQIVPRAVRHENLLTFLKLAFRIQLMKVDRESETTQAFVRGRALMAGEARAWRIPPFSAV